MIHHQMHLEDEAQRELTSARVAINQTGDENRAFRLQRSTKASQRKGAIMNGFKPAFFCARLPLSLKAGQRRKRRLSSTVKTNAIRCQAIEFAIIRAMHVRSLLAPLTTPDFP